ncbi:MAG: chloride channel protein [Acidimicrobiales bacterium]
MVGRVRHPRASTANERLRVPPPLLKRRLPSGRGAMEQPNITGDGEARLDPRFWLAVVVVGVAAGLGGVAMMAILFNVEHLAFDYHRGGFQAAVERSSGLRRVVVLLAAGAFGGPAWYLLRSRTPGESSDLDDAVWNGDGRLSWRRCLGTSVISEIVIGMGASIGREAAPKLLGGVSGNLAAHWLGLTSAQRRLLVACGGGAGLAAVYNVPLGGALFTAEILVGALTLPTVLPALACSCVATATAWMYLPNHATYPGVAPFGFSATLLVWSIPAGAAVGLLASGLIRLVGWVSHHSLTGRPAIAAPVGAFAVLGLVGLAYPELFGNGKDMASAVFAGHGSLILLLALFALKPVVTALCLGSGASGGLFTPFMSTGAVLGGFGGLVWDHLWPGAPLGAFALVGAAAMIGSSMQAPLTGVALVLELTHSGFEIVVPIVAATVVATAIVRWIDGYSIYSARLPAPDDGRRPHRAAGGPEAMPPAGHG